MYFTAEMETFGVIGSRFYISFRIGLGAFDIAALKSIQTAILQGLNARGVGLKHLVEICVFGGAARGLAGDFDPSCQHHPVEAIWAVILDLQEQESGFFEVGISAGDIASREEGWGEGAIVLEDFVEPFGGRFEV